MLFLQAILMPITSNPEGTDMAFSVMPLACLIYSWDLEGKG